MNTYEVTLHKVLIEAQDENEAYEMAKRLIESPDIFLHLSIISVDLH